jgi:hypothetical protein
VLDNVIKTLNKFPKTFRVFFVLGIHFFYKEIIRKIRHFVLFLPTKWRIFRILNHSIFAVLLYMHGKCRLQAGCKSKEVTTPAAILEYFLPALAYKTSL